MQILYCDSCGAKLPELDVRGNVDVAYCEKCAAERADPLGIMKLIPVAADAGRSSSIRLKAISDDSDGPAHASTTKGTSVAERANQLRSSGRLRSATAVRPRLQTPTDRPTSISERLPNSNGTAPKRPRKRLSLRRLSRAGSAGSAVGTCIFVLCAALVVFFVFNRNKPAPTRDSRAEPQAAPSAVSAGASSSTQPAPRQTGPSTEAKGLPEKTSAKPEETKGAKNAKHAEALRPAS